MKSSSALTAAKTVIRWLRWAVVLALVSSALGGLVSSAFHVPAPAPLAAVQNLMFMLLFPLKDAAFVVVGAKIAPRARRTTAIVLAAVYVPLSFWKDVLSQVSLVELVLLQGRGNYGQFILETLGAMLGVACILWSEKAQGSVASLPPSQLSMLEPPGGSAGTKAALTAVKTVIFCLRWAVVLALVCFALGELVYSALDQLAFAEMGRQAQALRPALLAVLQNLVFMLLFYALRETGVVVAGALIAPRFHLTTAIVLAALLVPLSFSNHVLATGGPWWSWTINYTHFTLEALGSVLGVVYIFWSEKAKGSVACSVNSTLVNRLC
jgi:hypothetical protein